MISKPLIIFVTVASVAFAMDRDLFPSAREKFGRDFDELKRAGKPTDNLCWGYFDGHDGYGFYRSPNGDNATAQALKKAYEIIYHPSWPTSEIHEKLKQWKKTQSTEIVAQLKKQKNQLLDDHKNLLAKVYDIIHALPNAFEKVVASLNRKSLTPRTSLHEAYAYLQKLDKNVAQSLLHIFDVIGCPLPADKKP